MDPRHRRLAKIARRAAGSDHGLALAGGYAVRAHGMGQRPSGDVDLFMDWQRRADFPTVADLVIGTDLTAVQRIRRCFADWRAELKND